MAAFIVYVGWRASTSTGLDACRLIAITLRGLLAAGFVAAIAWIMLPVARGIHIRKEIQQHVTAFAHGEPATRHGSRL
ncbi:MAG: hypothetical protein NTY19_09115 [Planctomycetota bacterium]|nr:hypothetical protein [Planctomycetota bacterium]